MSIYDKIIDVYPQLTDLDFAPIIGIIHLKDDGDGFAYIAKWEYDKPIPAGLKLGKD